MWWQSAMRRLFKLIRSIHSAIYRLTDGRIGSSIGKMPILILSTRGRRSGRVHKVPLAYLMEKDAYVVIASYRGQPRHPAWYLNLLDDPKAMVQVKGWKTSVTAQKADHEARQRLWTSLITRAPLYQVFQSRTKRQIPLVFLTPETN